jgi:CubicO group peptidase (beta-lactamase class C family)
MRRSLPIITLTVVAAIVLTACDSSSKPSGSPASTGSSSPATTSPTATSTATTTAASDSGVINAANVARGVAKLGPLITATMKKTGLPGLSVGVVYQGKVLYLKGFGVRDKGKPATVDPDTVFQLASLSKPLGSTVISSAITDKTPNASWDDRVQQYLPGFELADPWVSQHLTVADMYAHRSGLPDHAGDLLEDFGFTQAQILDRLRYEPLASFRNSYAYTNYGLTAGAEAFSAAVGTPWPTLAQQQIFGPLGMTDTSYSYADLMKRTDRASLHTLDGSTFTPNGNADEDRQAPAGGASSSARDLTKWMTMLLAGGVYNGKRIVDTKDLQQIWGPQNVISRPDQIGGTTSFYGLGWNVGYDQTGALNVNHSGAFGTGGATNVSLVPASGLGIVVLTNGYPMGIPEAISLDFLDDVRYGQPRQDWLTAYQEAFKKVIPTPNTSFSTPPKTVTPARSNAAYVGTYQNKFFGPMTVTSHGSGLVATVGPKHEAFPLIHYTGDRFYLNTIGENASGQSGVTFAASGSKITAVTVSAWNEGDLGTFRR